MADWLKPARRSMRTRRSWLIVARSIRAATASKGNSSHNKSERVMIRGAIGRGAGTGLSPNPGGFLHRGAGHRLFTCPQRRIRGDLSGLLPALILTPRGRGRDAGSNIETICYIRLARGDGVLTGTVCGTVSRFDPLRIVWHASGRAGYGLNLGKRPPIATHI